MNIEIMRKKCIMQSILLLSCLLASLLVGCNKKEPENVITNTDVKASVMANYIKSNERIRKYSVYDIDNDGNLELFTADSDSHADSVTVSYVDPDTYELTEIGSYGSWGSMQWYPEGGYIVSGYLGQGEFTTIVYKISKGNAEQIINMWDNEGTVDNEIVYVVNDVPTTEEKYHEIYKQYTSGEEVSMDYAYMLDNVDYDTNYNTICQILNGEVVVKINK